MAPMPHDKNGNELKVGDRVALFGTVKEITSEQPTYCNIQFETDEAMAPDAEKTVYALSARMVVAQPGVTSSMEFEAGAALAREGKPLPDAASENAWLGWKSITAAPAATPEDAKVSHDQQAQYTRERCLDLALRHGANPGAAITHAKEFFDYVTGAKKPEVEQPAEA